MHPAAVVEGVILLLQHQHLTLIPAVVVWTHILYPQGGLAMQTGPAWPRGEAGRGHGGEKDGWIEFHKENEGKERRWEVNEEKREEEHWMNVKHQPLNDSDINMQGSHSADTDVLYTLV